MKRSKGTAGFSMIELMAVIVILGILATVAVFSYNGYIQRARRQAAETTIKDLVNNINIWAQLNNSQYPETLDVLAEELPGGYEPVYPEGIPRDPWGNEYHYFYPGTHAAKFDVVSYGADGQPGGEGEDADVNSWEIGRSDER